MKKGFLVLFLLAAMACATGDAPMESRLVSEADLEGCPPDHRAPSEVAVVVYEENGTVYTVPEVIVLENPQQRVIWTTVNGEITDIEFSPSSCSPAPPAIRERGRQIQASFPRGYRGGHKYSYTFIPDVKGEPVEVDPFIIIEY